MTIPRTTREWFAVHVATVTAMKEEWVAVAVDASLRDFDQHAECMDNTQLVCATEPECICAAGLPPCPFECDCSSLVNGAWGGVCSKCRAPMVRIDCNSGARRTS